jgi:hypothetical protein
MNLYVDVWKKKQKMKKILIIAFATVFTASAS